MAEPGGRYDALTFYSVEGVFGSGASVSKSRLKKLVKLFKRLDGSSLLDIGCGDGYVLSELQKIRPDIVAVGVDISKKAVEITKQRGLNASICDIQDGLTFPEESFEIVHAGEIVEHVLDTDFFLEEIKRVLTPNGTLVLSTPNLASWINRIMLLLGFQPAFTEVSYRENYGRRLGHLGRHAPPVGHIRVFTHRALKEFLREHGFKIVRVIGCAMVPYALNRPFDYFFSVFPSLSSVNIYVAKKSSDVSSGSGYS